MSYHANIILVHNQTFADGEAAFAWASRCLGVLGAAYFMTTNKKQADEFIFTSALEGETLNSLWEEHECLWIYKYGDHSILEECTLCNQYMEIELKDYALKWIQMLYMWYAYSEPDPTNQEKESNAYYHNLRLALKRAAAIFGAHSSFIYCSNSGLTIENAILDGMPFSTLKARYTPVSTWVRCQDLKTNLLYFEPFIYPNYEDGFWLGAENKDPKIPFVYEKLIVEDDFEDLITLG